MDKPFLDEYKQLCAEYFASHSALPEYYYPASTTWTGPSPSPTPQPQTVHDDITYNYDFVAFQFDSDNKIFILHLYKQQDPGGDVYVFDATSKQSRLSPAISINAVPYPNATKAEQAIAQDQFTTFDWCRYCASSVEETIDGLHAIDQANPNWKTKYIFGVDHKIEPQKGWWFLQPPISSPIRTVPNTPSKR